MKVVSVAVLLCVLAPGRASAEPSPVAPVSLPALLAYAEAHAPALHVAAARRAQGAAARAGAGAVFAENPSFELAFGPRFAGARRGYELELGLSQPLEIAGQRGARQRAAARFAEEASADAGAARAGLHAELKLAYRLAQVAAQRLALAQRARAFAGELGARVQARLARGDVSAIDARLAEVEAARAEEEFFSAEQAEEQARLELCALSGWPEQAPPQVMAELEPPQVVPSPEVLLARRGAEPPELVAKRAARRQAEARAELAEREGWPNIVLGVEYTRESDVLVNDIVVGTLGVELPLWQHNQAERGRALGEAGLARAEEQASAARLRVGVRVAYRALEAARLRLGRFDAALAAPVQEGLRLLRRGFEAGEIALGELTFAHERWLLLQRENLEVYAEYYRALAALESALGVDLGVVGGAP